MADQSIEVNGVELCAETFGDRGAPPILLIAGIGSSMLWWEEGFCELLADGGCFIIRYDHRDTGRSVTYEPLHPEYTGADLTADALGVLDAFGLSRGHVVGVSAGGGIAQELAVDHGDRISSLTLIGTSPALPTDADLPAPTDEFGEFVSTAEVDWSDAQSVIDYLVDYSRMLSGTERPFDEPAVRSFITRDVERARSFPALQNHDLMSQGDGPDGTLSSITAPTLVIHGTADPMFPVQHGEALAREIPDGRLVLLEGAGHGVYPDDWERIAGAILGHTQEPNTPTINGTYGGVSDST